MTWYTASVVMAIHITGQVDGEITAYENMVLFEANSMKDALEKAHIYGREQVLDDTIKVNNRPAKMSFAGIRKIVTVSNPHPLDLDADAPTTGTEVTYSCFSIRDNAALEKFVAGDAVDVTYID